MSSPPESASAAAELSIEAADEDTRTQRAPASPARHLSPTSAAAPPPLPAASQPHIHYAEVGTGPSTLSAPPALSVDAQLASSHGHGQSYGQGQAQGQDGRRPLSESNVPVHGAMSAVDGPGSLLSPTTPGGGLRRRGTKRAVTFRNVDNFSEYDVRPGWQPGSEPGIDTSKPDGGRATLATMMSPSEITVVDFSQDDIMTTRLDNATLAGFLAVPQPRHMKCRWINVNGLSWDVIQILGNHKRLHRLAIEDLINTRNRTKADWYTTHIFMVLTLQKLVHFDFAKNRISRSDDSDSDSGESDDGDDTTDDKNGDSVKSGRSSHSRKSGISRRFRRMFSRRHRRSRDASRGQAAASAPTYAVSARNVESGPRPPVPRTASIRDAEDLSHVNSFRTLQRYHSSPNDARTDFMESHSALSSKNLAVAAEQVSIFITDDNTVISFFELSAQDVEQPILKRLRLADTSLRRSCDASLITQAILDAIIDLAIPVTVCYGDVISDLELDVLTSPSVRHTKSLYITITEMNKVLSFINPVMNLINTLRDHKTDSVALDDFQNPATGVTISSTTYVYLSDVLDHCVLITESLDQIRGQAEHMISLIFNTISANQNESMKQLTIVTIIFLPLTFLTGYFGQNFDGFADLELGIPFFWKIAGPVIFFTVVIMMYDMILRYCRSLIQRRHILRLRKHRRKRSKAKN
ncbi:hypothetical protein SPBR_00311 [Sporothrix brasiliensis 5110]|uniref:Uncharacterized protein n=1 Tax=Sporothrix brasiliensis 5110 TaxID=1398154 RepID=A0A0C2IUP4_9PEZI|nr:uncharacterized protein SPBR_00311 [Sporothrix brasiliensis 5110]KIH90490.1 hypothetical protein SPBR_00311 [Sporothrix brasiliensis 5110]